MVISEVTYDLPGSDSGREWIEVKNVGAESISFSDWRLFENGANHKLIPHDGVGVLAPGAYAVIVSNVEKFRTDWPHFSGILFDSVFDLGEKLPFAIE